MTTTVTHPAIDTATPVRPEPGTDSSDTTTAAATSLVKLQDLNVWFTDASGAAHHVVHDLSLDINPGECVAVIGESGSGKSVTARTLIGLTGSNSHIQATRATVGGRDIQATTDAQWRRIRGTQIGFILQDALVSLDPLRTIGAEIGESLRLHGVTKASERRGRVLELLHAVGVPEPEMRARQRSGELSGGLRQRALIASAIANDPSLLVADEPTTALDVTVQAQVLDLLAQRKAAGSAILLISHDFSVVGRLADRVLVMQGGHIVEQGSAERVLNNPRHQYTRQLLDAVPSGTTKGEYLTSEKRAQAREAPKISPVRAESEDTPPVLEATGLTKSFRGPDGVTRTVVKDVSFEVRAGQTLGIVGESGSGKSTTASMALGFLQPDSGTVLLNGKPWSELGVAGRRSRRREVTVVYQDPLSSFDPRWTAEQILTDALEPAAGGIAFGARRRQRTQLRERAEELVRLVGLDPQHLAKHPLQLSGGQRQRLSIARALAPEPDVVVLDEAVSALDVSVQAQVLDLLTELQERLGTTYVFISHDLGVIHHMSDHILVMKDGEAVEYGDAEQIFHSPAHPYTQELLGSLQTLTAHTPGNR
ncbi:dipeptide ABC transporter ATP-binding protein [Nesterenkonia lutea]|uniref:Peptide/nickel transport system ATP-binding protein n=1 Tax=Nesterenkonia lutea TaxID=272919 RepID=A0ABR9JEM7_9MICC|nr:ABC transporter ATP-binding protein [Nesterenkonia lutea]MBE1524388.1 peptide/nickel transport system ATP-binding protein [Nesterenkonia lutea]